MTLSRDFIVNPVTSAAWTVADVNGSGSNPLQAFGLDVTVQYPGNYYGLTQIYLTVNYALAGAFCAMGSGGIFSTPAIAAVIG